MVYKDNIERATLSNKYYRKVISITKQMQLVYMCLDPTEEIGSEVHPDTTQFIRIESGGGTAMIGNKRFKLTDGSALLIPSKIRHNIIAGKDGLTLYSLYSPPEHPVSRLQMTKPRRNSH
jgi:mannose-6-phosphate isomerase-like protein (cupin superfamily)